MSSARRPRHFAHEHRLAAIAVFVAVTVLAAQTSVGAPGNSIAIVSNLGGALTVRDSSGVSHDVSGAQPMRSGDTAMTGINALASITLSGMFRTRLGAGTVVQYYASGTAPSLRLSAGALCVSENAPGVTVAAAGTALTAVDTPAVFDIATGHSGTTIVLYSGSMAALVSGSKSNVVHAPAAFSALPGGQFTASPFDATAASIASMPCPDRDAAKRTALTLSSPTPAVEATVASSSGGGGGGILGIIAGIAGLAALAGHGGGGGGGGSNPPPPVPSPSPGTLQVTPTSLSFTVGGAPQTVTATESNYSGQLTATSPKPSIATVSPSSGSSGVIFTVTPVGPGNTSFTVSDNHGGSVPVSISVATTGALVVSPLDFHTQPINSSPLLLHVSESNYSGPFNVTSDHPNIVVVGGGGNGPTPPPFTVTPTHNVAGPAHITVADSLHNPVVVPITIAGPIVDNPSALNAITAPTTFMSTDAFYTGLLSASSNNNSVATVSGGGNGPGPVTFTVTPHLQGNAVITVTDTLLQTATVPVSVSTGGLVLNPTSLTFDTPGGESLTFNATEPNYTGNITPSGCSTSIVTVSPTVGTGPSQDFTVKSVGPGSCTLTVATGDQTAMEGITVFGDLKVMPSSLTYTDVNVTQPVAVHESNYTGAFSVTANTCPGIANVGAPSSGGPDATINVTSSVSMSGGSCSFQVNDDHGGALPVFVTVGPFGSPVPLPSNLTLNTANNTSGPIGVSESGYSGQFTPTSSDCSGIATITPAQGTNFTVTEAGAGTCHFKFADDHGQSATATIVVDGALVLSPNPINFGDVNVTLPVSINEPNYTGAFSVANDSCNGNVATIGTPAGPGPSTTVNVTSLKQGLCTFSIQDTDGQSVQENVSVGPFGAPTPSTSQMMLNITNGPLTGTFTISETGYNGFFTLTQSSACTGVASVSPGNGNQLTTFTVTAAAVGTCGIRIADDVGQTANVEVEVAGGTMSVTPASLFFPTTTSPEQDVAASDPAATGFTCVSSDSTDVTATITVQNTGSATCAVTPTNSNPGFQGTLQVTFGDSLGSSAVVQVGVVLQPLSKIHRVVPGGVKRPMPNPRAPHPVVPPAPLPNPAGQSFTLSAQQVILAANARQPIAASVFNYHGTLVASSSSPNVADVMVVAGTGPMRSIIVIAKAPGSTMIRIADDRGHAQFVHVIVALGLPGHLTPGGRPGGPPRTAGTSRIEDHR
jgi:hypothetical protein